MNEARDELVRPDETLDELFRGELRVLQKRRGYRFSMDAVLLAAFARVRPGERVADLGAGCGIVGLILAKRTPLRELVALEVQPELADLAERNVRLNGLEGRVRVVRGDWRRPQGALDPQGFDVVVSNPPYHLPHRRAGPPSQRLLARHQLLGGLDELARACRWALREGGRAYLIWRAERAVDLLEALRTAGLEPKRLRAVHGRPSREAKLLLLEARRGGGVGMRWEPPLFLQEETGQPSAELLEIYRPRIP